jgi:hypothetical protein
VKRFGTYAGLSTAAVTSAVTLVLALPLADDLRSAALLGVALSGASGGLALVVKRRALMRNGITAALAAFAVMFGVRVLLLALGLATAHHGDAELGFVGGFFAVYFVQQTIELSWVVAASKEQPGVQAT